MENKDVLYAKWLSGEISDEEVRSAIGADGLADLKQVVDTVDQWSMPKYDTSAGYKKFKQKHPTKPAKVRKINWFKVSSIAASFLILVFFSYRYFTNQNQVIFASNGQNENIVLSDESEVWLNDGSTVEYNAKSWKDQRTIELSGEALFEVTKGSPFTVKTQNGSIRVLGTQFNVRAWGANLYVECYEGKVQVTVENQEMILTANEAVNVVAGIMNEKQVINNEAPSWQNATSRFYDENLRNVFEELERQYDVKVNMKATDRKFSGNFRHDDLDTALRLICKPLGLKYTISENQKMIIIE